MTSLHMMGKCNIYQFSMRKFEENSNKKILQTLLLPEGLLYFNSSKDKIQK